MNEVEKKDVPEISGGRVDTCGNPVAVTYPIYQIPPPEQPNPLIVPESPAPDPLP
jgi:hypothetical protein